MAASEQGDGNNDDGVGQTPRAGGETRQSVFDRLGDGPVDMMVALEILMQEDDQRRILATLDRALLARRRRPSGGEPGR